MTHIPHILHQLDNRKDPLEEWTKDYIVTLKHWHPHWKYMFWDASKLYDLVKSDYLWLLPTYNKCSNIERSDLGRYCILHKHGGVYIDTDMFFLASLDQVIQRAPHGMWLAHSGPVFPTSKPMLTNYIMASPPQHPFWLEVLNEAAHRLNTKKHPWWAVSKALTVPYMTGKNVLSAIALQKDFVNVFQEPEVLNLYCRHTPVTMDCVAVHNGGTSRTFPSKGWNTLSGFIRVDCKIRKMFGIVPNSFQFPVCILVGVILVVMVVISVTFVCIHYAKRLIKK